MYQYLTGEKNWEFDNVYIYFSLNCLSLRNSVWWTLITARCKHGDWMEFNVGTIVHIIIYCINWQHNIPLVNTESASGD